MRKVSKKKADPFYKLAAWLKTRTFVLQRDHYLCQPCFRDQTITAATIVHHIKPREDFPELALELNNLESICASCHNKEHPEKGGGQKKGEQKQRRATIIVSKANRERF